MNHPVPPWMGQPGQSDDRSADCLPTLANQDRLSPDQIERLRMVERLGSVPAAKRVTFLHLRAMWGGFDDDR
jgi:hypothetical protein